MSLIETPAGGLRGLIDANPIVGKMRTGPKRFWTGREEKLVREHYPTGGLAACLEVLPGRSATSIYQRARILGVLSPQEEKRKGRPRQRWTTNEHIDAAIRRTYEQPLTNNAVRNLALAVMRPRWWVTRRATEMGLVQPRFGPARWSDEELEMVRERRGQSPRSITKALAGKGYRRSESAVTVQMKRLGISTAAEEPDVWTARGLGEALGINGKTVASWVDRGLLRARKGAGPTGDYRIRTKDVRDFIIDNVAIVDIRKADKFWLVDLLAGARASGAE